ncbi:MAG: SDR family NAD(P)-dependent oxidoreductase [Sulfuricurvum sp.]
MKNAIVFSVSSGIGYSLCLKLIQEGYSVFGTYKTFSDDVQNLKELGVNLYQSDLLIDVELDKTIKFIKEDVKTWDALFILQATMNPIGKLLDIDMQQWEESIKLNFVNQIKIIHLLLDNRTKRAVPTIITFAGGGTNSGVSKFSAYTISKISLIKMMELLYEEYPDTKFVCVGPGWVKTKIHNETIQAKGNAVEAYTETMKHLDEDNFTDINKVVDCLFWIVNANKEHVSGRNFSVAFDDWGSDFLNHELKNNCNMYKLRREGNQWKH